MFLREHDRLWRPQAALRLVQDFTAKRSIRSVNKRNYLISRNRQLDCWGLLRLDAGSLVILTTPWQGACQLSQD